MNKNNINFAFFGTGDFAVGVLEELVKKGFTPDLIVTAPDKPQGRKMILTPSPVKTRIMNYDLGIKNKIEVLQPVKLDDDFGFRISDFGFNLFIVADYGKIIPQKILDIPKKGVINVHPSMLPKFRGASPIQSFIMSDEKETGVTIIKMDAEVDHGPILARQELEIRNSNIEIRNNDQIQNLKYKDLEKILASLGGKLLAEILPDYIDGKIKAKEQDHSKATFTKKIEKEDGLIKLDDNPETIYKKFLALTPWPGVYFFTSHQKRVIITEAKLEKALDSSPTLVIEKVKPEGKNEMPFEDFLRGNKIA